MKTLKLLGAALLTAAMGSAHAVGSLVNVTVHDRSQGREVPVYYHQGRHYVVGHPGSEYQVVLHNRSGARVLTVVSVDGVNAVSGETAAPDQTGYVLSPWMRTEIKGWRKSSERVAAFYFTQLPDSYAARTGRPDNVGVIGVAVFRERLWPRPQPQPQPYSHQERSSDEAPAEGAADRSGLGKPLPGTAAEESAAPRTLRKSLGTGHGRSETDHVSYTRFERASSHPDEVITLYYDSHRNLVARGVIPTPRPDPQPFPAGFVPDPPRG